MKEVNEVHSATGGPFLFYKTIQVIDHDTTGKYFREKRIKAKITLRATAKALQWSPAYLSQLENGIRNWDNKKAKKYYSFLTKERWTAAYWI
jgi:hypothetical protein